jgi:hypothetical protein
MARFKLQDLPGLASTTRPGRKKARRNTREGRETPADAYTRLFRYIEAWEADVASIAEDASAPEFQRTNAKKTLRIYNTYAKRALTERPDDVANLHRFVVERVGPWVEKRTRESRAARPAGADPSAAYFASNRYDKDKKYAESRLPRLPKGHANRVEPEEIIALALTEYYQPDPQTGKAPSVFSEVEFKAIIDRLAQRATAAAYEKERKEEVLVGKDDDGQERQIELADTKSDVGTYAAGEREEDKRQTLSEHVTETAVAEKLDELTRSGAVDPRILLAVRLITRRLAVPQVSVKTEKTGVVTIHLSQFARFVGTTKAEAAQIITQAQTLYYRIVQEIVASGVDD